MADLRSHYLGLELSTPLVPSSSPLSRDVDMVRRLEDAGAGAIVLHSLFEEEIHNEQEQMLRFADHAQLGHAEADGFLPTTTNYTGVMEQYLQHLITLKRDLSIPVIASLNGVSLDGWVETGKELQAAGADALELNVYYVAADAMQTSYEVELRYIELIRELKQYVTIPITVKLGSQISALPNFILNLEDAGASGVSLFNRFYQPDIDLESLQIKPQLEYSSSTESLLRIRWIAMLYGRVGLSLAVTGGFHTANDTIKALLAGADIVHQCSALLQHGPEYIARVKEEVEQWLDSHEYESVKQLRGSLSHKHSHDPAALERANYLNVINSHTAYVGVKR